eukprot:1103131-Pyramimonas_sp.AAC.1
MTDQSDAGRAGIFSRRTNVVQPLRQLHLPCQEGGKGKGSLEQPVARARGEPALRGALSERGG